MSEDSLAVQDDELSALESIYPGHVSIQRRDEVERQHVVVLTIPVELPQPTATQLDSQSSLSGLRLSHLPPLSARLVLPPLYPAGAPPRIVSLRAPLPQGQTGWLSRRMLAQVQDRLLAFWEEEKEFGTGVLWRWWEWIGTAAFLEDLGLLNGGALTLPTPQLLPSSSFHLLLKSHDAATVRADFEATAFACGICFETPKGRKCDRLPGCGCVFCHACLSSYWTLAIQEGTLQSVACPSISCVKKRGAVDHSAGANAEEREDGISPQVVESVVGKDLTRRWRLLSEKRLVDTDPTYTFCPRANCQAPVPANPDRPTQTPPKAKVFRIDVTPSAALPASPARAPPSDEQLAVSASRWDNFRKCQRCNYVFCLLCRCLWHGAHTPCQIRDPTGIVQEYMNADEAGRLALEARLGVRNMEALQALVRDYEREQLVLNWIKENTTACPSCQASIEKSEGCNHMTCGRCATHFCYRCGKSISSVAPYEHFNQPGKPCYNKLFDFEQEQDFWIPFEADE